MCRIFFVIHPLIFSISNKKNILKVNEFDLGKLIVLRALGISAHRDISVDLIKVNGETLTIWVVLVLVFIIAFLFLVTFPTLIDELIT